MTWRPGKRFRVGGMRHRITVQSFAELLDGNGQLVATWSNFRTNEPAEFHDVGGGTSYRGKQLQENIRAVFIVRYREGYDTTQRITHDGQSYGITRVSRVDGGYRYLELFCTGVAA